MGSGALHPTGNSQLHGETQTQNTSTVPTLRWKTSVLESHSTADAARPGARAPRRGRRPTGPPPLDSLCTLTRPSASGTAVRRCCGPRTRAAGGALTVPPVSAPAPSHLEGPFTLLTGLGSRSGFTPRELWYVRCRWAAWRRAVWWARLVLGCSHAPWADLVLGGERTEAKGPGSGLEQETGGDTGGTRVAPRDPSFVTRARLRARGDLQREWTAGDFGVATSVTLVTGKQP